VPGEVKRAESSEADATPIAGAVGIKADEVRAQLGRIVSHPLFQKCERMSGFLRYIVTQTLDGHSGRIKQRTVAMEVYSRGRDFDPRIDPIVRIEATRLRRLLSEYYAGGGRSDPIRIDVPKGGYVPKFELNGSRSCDVNVAGDDWLTGPHGGPSVAVLYFTNGKLDDDADFVPYGITEELINRLTCFTELSVVGPLSSEQNFSDALSQARRARARFALHGQVQQFRQRLRISASLCETRDGTTLWAQNYDRDLSVTDWFAMEDEIAASIAGAVADDFGVITRTLAEASKATRTSNFHAYEAVLQARRWMQALDNKSLVKAKQSLEIAVNEDRGYALTKALLSDIYAIDYHLDLGVTGHDSPLDVAERLAREAVSLDPFCQTSAWCLAGVHFHRRRRDLCIAELERTLALNPNHPSSNGNCGLFFTMLGDHSRGIDLIQKAMRLNPHHPSWYHFCLFMDAYCRGDFEEALREAVKFQSPDLFWPPLLRTAALGQLGHVEDAGDESRELLARFPGFHRRGVEVMRMTVYTDDHVQKLLDGLAKARLPLPRDR
jgi:adenylate cyclase